MHRTSYILAAFCLGGLGGCSDSAPQTPSPVLSRPVRTVSVRAHSVSEPIVLTGYIVAREEIKLAFAIDGKMIERAVSVGDQVRAGQLLARLDPENEQNSLSLSEAEVSGADASLTQAHNNESRIRKAGGATNEQLEQAIQQTKAAQAQRDGAGVRLKMAQDRLRYTELRRDVAGVVIAKGAEPNEIVRAGQPIVVLARNDWKDALFQIPPQLAFLRDVTAETLI